MKYLFPLMLGFFVISCSTPSPLTSQPSTYWQQEANYEMDIEMDADAHQFTGVQKITYTNNSPDTLYQAYYHLYFNAFKPNSMMDKRSRTIDDPDNRVGDRISELDEDEIGYQRVQSLKQNGENLEYNEVGTILEVELNEPIAPGEEVIFEMEFDAQVPLQIRRSGRDNAEGVEFSMTQWYPKLSEYDHRGWHPNPYIGREFHGVFGDFDVRITMDSSYVIAATGELQNPEEIGYGYEQEGMEVSRPDTDRLTWHWKAENVHDFAWGADPDYTHTQARVPDGPTLHFFYQTDPVAENATNISQEELRGYWEELPEFAVAAFEYMNEHFGEYPYESYSFVQGGDGGMEYPMLTLITGYRSLPSLVGVSVHELVHAWYHTVLATNESLYPWMDEGFTSYASSRIMNELFDRNQDNPHQGSYASYFNIVEAGEEEALDTHADHFVTNRAYGVASYSKGAVFLHQLEYIIGKEAFDRGMKRYYDGWKFKHPTDQDFVRVMEKTSGMVLDWYHEYWIQTTKTIDYSIEDVISIEDETYVTLTREELTPMPIDLHVEYEDGTQELFYIPLRIMRGEKPNETSSDQTVLEDWPWVFPSYTLKLERELEEIKRIEIDPTRRMADIDRSNNVFVKENYIQEFEAN